MSERAADRPSEKREGEGDGARHPLLRLGAITKRYGHTQALAGVDLTVGRGEVLGVVGHNGAGKSTLMRVIVGITIPDSGTIEFGKVALANGYSPDEAYGYGIRIVFQELALCPSLRVFENVRLARPSLSGVGWRRRARQIIGDSLQEVFPGNGISSRDQIGQLPLAHRQMVEIAQAVIGGAEEVRLLVLDEPTSALSKESADQLYTFVKRLRSAGVSTVVISHRMQEVLANTDRTVVMRDGKVVGNRISRETSHDELLDMMGAAAIDGAATSNRGLKTVGDRVLDVRQLSTRRLNDVSLHVCRGEVVGFAGLDGQGQHQLLVELWRRRRGRPWGGHAVRCRGKMAFLTGDRQSAGVFPLWDLRRNASVSAMDQVSSFGVLRTRREIALVERWIERLSIRGRRTSKILELSGGTQQKVLVARALATRANLVLLDDPFRGVDVATKREIYRLIAHEAAAGRAFIWFSTENAELEECDRVYVLRLGRIVAELAGDDAREDRVIAASFAPDSPGPDEEGAGTRKPRGPSNTPWQTS